MAAQSQAHTTVEELESGLLGQIEVHSIDWIPDPERHGKNWQQSMLWFLGNFQYFTIPDYSWLVGLAVSGLVYWLVSRSLDVSAEQSAIDASEQELRAIDAIAAAQAPG